MQNFGLDFVDVCAEFMLGFDSYRCVMSHDRCKHGQTWAVGWFTFRLCYSSIQIQLQTIELFAMSISYAYTMLMPQPFGMPLRLYR